MKKYLSDQLPWAGIFAPGVGFLKDGAWIATFKFTGHDLDSVTEQSLGEILDYQTSIITKLGPEYGLFFEARRRPAAPYPVWTGPQGIAAMIDEERQALFGSGMYWETDYYLSVTWMPNAMPLARLMTWLTGGKEVTTAGTLKEQQETFSREMHALALELRRCYPFVEFLQSPDDIVTYWASTLRPGYFRLDAPEVLYNLDRYVGQVHVTGGLRPCIEGVHTRMLRIETYPAGVFPGAMDVLHHLNFPFRYCVRYLPLSRDEALKEAKRAQQRWSMRTRTLAQYAKEGFSASETDQRDLNLAAQDMAAEMQYVRKDIEMGDVGMGYLTPTVQVWGDTSDEADDVASVVKSVLHAAHFGAEIEGMNAIQAWFGSLPGEHRANVRRPIVTSKALSRLTLSTSVWGGQDTDEYWGYGPLCVGEGTGATPFRMSLHVGDVGHVAVIGPTGAGKSTLLTFLALQGLRYPDLNVFVFDKGQAFRPFISVLGGAWCNIGVDKSVGGVTTQPLRYIDDDAERTWANEWVFRLIHPYLSHPTPAQRKIVWDALGDLAELPPRYRTLSGLAHICQDEDVIAAIEPFTASGAAGMLFDSDNETLAVAQYCVFECETLFKRQELITPTLEVAVHRLQRLLQRDPPPPSLLMIFEAWRFLGDDAFAPQIESWLRELRKLNVSLIMEFTSLHDIVEHPKGGMMLESCKTKIFLPNPEAMSPLARRAYEAVGLTEQQICLIAGAKEKRDYYYASPHGNRLFSLNLEHNPIAAALCTRGSIQDLTALQHIQSRVSSDEFAPAWFEHCGLPHVAASLRETGVPRPTGAHSAPQQLNLTG